MESLAQVGTLYVYMMLAILAIGLGYLAFRGIAAIISLTQRSKSQQKIPKKNTDAPWIRLVFISATILFVAVFSLGILGVVGGGTEHNHASNSLSGGSQALNTDTSGYDYQHIQDMQSQLLNISDKITSIENSLQNK